MTQRIAMLLVLVGLCSGVAVAATDVLSVSGTVVTSDNTQIVIRTDDGTQRTLVLDPAGPPAPALTIGNRVNVRYRVLDPDRWQFAGLVETDRPMDTASSTTPSETTPANETGEALPATASSLPLVGLLAFSALGAGLALHTLRQKLA